MFYGNWLVHFHKVMEGVALAGGTAELDFETLQLTVTSSNRYFQLNPVFMARVDGELRFEPALSADSGAFGGWHLAPKREDDPEIGPLAFKKFCAANRLLVPSLVQDETSSAWTVVKEVARIPGSSRVVGPFKLSEALRRQSFAPTRLFVEEFIQGDQICAWYWNGALACVDRRSYPTVTGNGRTTIRDMVGHRYPEIDWRDVESLVEAMAALQGIDRGAVVPEGKTVALDFKFYSPFHPQVRASENVFSEIAGTVAGKKLRDAAPIFQSWLPESTRAQKVLIVFGVIDAQQNVYFNDMHIARWMHPDVYGAIATRLLGVSPVQGN